ncbi:MAG TPA: DUF4062 domain-containing protein [Cyclobacteriaceae bacterium]
MNADQDIVILHSSLDDEPIEGSVHGWISNFKRFLDTLFFQLTRSNPTIHAFTENNVNQSLVDNAEVCICVISEHFIEERVLINSVKAFNMNHMDNMMANGRPVLFKVLKYPVDTDEVLPEISNIETYDFFQYDSLSGEVIEYKKFFGGSTERSYWMKLVDMAYDIIEVLFALSDDKQTTDNQISVQREKTVYLASTGVDVVIQRDIIKRELIRHGYNVLPIHSLPKEAKALEEMVENDIKKCRMSIHLVGEDYGYKPKGSDLSVIDIQNKIATKHTRKVHEKNVKGESELKFNRLIWLSPNFKNVSERQKIFIEDLKTDAAMLDEAEVLQIPLQELKSIVREELLTGGRFKIKRDSHIEDNQEDQDRGKLVYLIFDKNDAEGSHRISETLKEQGYNVISAVHEGDLVDLRYLHQENLRRCDATLIYTGEANENWIKIKLLDLLKAPGFGRNKPMKAKALLIDNQRDLDLDKLKINNTMVLQNDLKPFLEKI